MDEERAAEYYEEILRKGGGAAKLKQGLGYGRSSSPKASSAAAFPSFVRGDNHEESLAKAEKESRLAAVRDKLKGGRSAKYESSDDDHARSNRNRISLSPSRKRKSEAFARESRSPSRSRSPCRDRESPSRHGKSHRRDRSSGGISSREADHRRRSVSRSPSSDKKTSYRSERKKQGAKARRRSRSPRNCSRRSRSMSPAGNRLHSHRASSRDGHSHKDSKLFKDRKSAAMNKVARNPNLSDYAKLIPGFEEMTPAEKVKEKMKLQLSDTVSKDRAKGVDDDWERFVFNKNAPLDDDAKLDDFGDGTGAQDDTKFLQHTGSSFWSANTNQAKREAHIQAAHDAAIFGPPLGMSSEKLSSCGIQSDGSSAKELSLGDTVSANKEGVAPISNLLSDQISAFQQGSWRERALRLKQQRAGNNTM